MVLHYDVSEESIMSDDTCMCKWRIRTENVVARGGLFEIAKQGMLLATFGEDNKLRNVEVSFDVMSFMQQLRRTSEREGFQVCDWSLTDLHGVEMVIIFPLILVKQHLIIVRLNV